MKEFTVFINNKKEKMNVEKVEMIGVTPTLTTNLGILKVMFRLFKLNDSFQERVGLVDKNNSVDFIDITNYHTLINFICDNGNTNSTLRSHYTN